MAEIGQEKEALKQFEKAKTLVPDNTNVFYNLGLLYGKINEKNLAEQTLVEGLKSNPSDGDLLYALAYFYLTNEEVEKAKNIALK